MSIVLIGQVVVVLGFLGAFVLEGGLAVGFAVASGVGAIPIIGSGRTDAQRTFGVALVFGSLALLHLAAMHAEVMGELFVLFTWFVIESRTERIRELYRPDTTGGKAGKNDESS